MMEVIVSALIVAVGIGGAIATLGAPQKQTFSAQRYAIAATLAENDINQVAGRSWSDICTSGTITSGLSGSNQVVSSSPNTPYDFVGGTGGSQRFLILSNYKSIPAGTGGTYDPSSLIVATTPSNGEQLVTGSSGGGSPNCVPAASSINSAGVTGTLYRFVTYANETCTPTLNGALTTSLNQLLGGLSGLTSLLNAVTGIVLSGSGGLNLFCTAPNNEKRITEAVVLNIPANGSAPALPVYLTTLIPNPASGIFAGSSNGNGLTATCTLSILFVVIGCSASAH
ncbi:MAG: type IV pilus modification PilV family protein [Solirubrobacteraceae bacterium]